MRGPHQRDEGRAHQGEHRELEREPLYGSGGRHSREQAEGCVMNSHAHFGSSPLGQSLPSLRPLCRAWSVLLMDHDDAQPALAQLWRQARDGNLTPWPHARAWALREVWKETHGDKTYGLLSHVASRLKKQGGGKPSVSAVSQLFQKNGQRCRLVSRKVLWEPWRQQAGRRAGTRAGGRAGS